MASYLRIIVIFVLYLTVNIYTMAQNVSTPSVSTPSVSTPSVSTASGATTASGAATASGATIVSDDMKTETVMLTFAPDATPPKNVFTDKYGKPINQKDIKNIKIKEGQVLQLVTQQWITFNTRGRTIPGCLCVTRGPISLFKLRGNIHFPRIKVTPERYVTPPTEPSTTLCPPCVCRDCN